MADRPREIGYEFHRTAFARRENIKSHGIASKPEGATGWSP